MPLLDFQVVTGFHAVGIKGRFDQVAQRRDLPDDKAVARLAVAKGVSLYRELFIPDELAGKIRLQRMEAQLKSKVGFTSGKEHPQHGLQEGWAVHVQGILPTQQVKRTQQSRQSEEMVAMQVRNEDGVEL